MTHDECFYLGRITKPFGIKGQVVFFLDVDDPEQYAQLDTVLVDVKGALVPYFFHIDNLNGNKAVVTFEELTAQEALALVGRELYLPCRCRYCHRCRATSSITTKWWDSTSSTRRMATSARCRAWWNTRRSHCFRSTTKERRY